MASSCPRGYSAVAVRYADDRFFKIVVAKADRAQHRPVRRALDALGNDPTVLVKAHLSDGKSIPQLLHDRQRHEAMFEIAGIDR